MSRLDLILSNEREKLKSASFVLLQKFNVVDLITFFLSCCFVLNSKHLLVNVVVPFAFMMTFFFDCTQVIFFRFNSCHLGLVSYSDLEIRIV